MNFGPPELGPSGHRSNYVDDIDQSENSFALDFERYWHEAVSLKYWLAAIIALGLLFGVLVTLLATPLYQAKGRLEVSQVATDVTNLDKS